MFIKKGAAEEREWSPSSYSAFLLSYRIYAWILHIGDLKNGEV